MFRCFHYSLILFVIAVFYFTVSAHSRVAKPNIIVIVLDDQNNLALEFLPFTQSHFVKGGTRFLNAFVTMPQCGPSRASFLTGQYVQNHRVLGHSPVYYREYKSRELDTLPVWLRDAGYTTALIGKYINGYDGKSPIPAGWDHWIAFVSPAYWNYTLNENGKFVDYGRNRQDYSTDVLSNKAKRFIADNAASPFFMYITPKAPHTSGRSGPFPAPRHRGLFAGMFVPKSPNFNEADVSDKPNRIRNRPLLTAEQVADIDKRARYRRESLLAVDDMIGSIMSTLAAHRLLDDTIMILSSDNGYLRGSHRWIGKGVPYEESIGVPLFMRGPGIPARTTRNEMVLNIDLTATILDWAGASDQPAAPLDGRSLMPLLDGTPPRWRKALLSVSTHGNASFSAVRTSSHVYVQYDNGTQDEELYDLNSDKYQMVNQLRSPGRQETFRVLERMLNTLKACKGESCWID